MTRQQRYTPRFLAAILAAAAIGCRPAPADLPPATAAQGIPRGGDLRVAVRTEPQSFNWYTRHDGSTYIVTALTQARLFQVNRATQEVEPWLAEGSTRSADGLQYTIKLRPNIVFADGHPFTSEDVVFSFAAVYNERAGSVLADAMKVAGKPLQVAAVDPLTVIVTFPVPFAPGLVLLDNLPILPKHKLQASLDAGTFGSAWGLGTPVARDRRARPVRAGRVRARPADGICAQPEVFPEGRRRRAPSVSRSRHRRGRARPERAVVATRYRRSST